MDYVETVQEIDWRLLKQITVEKSDGEKTPFYAYKIDLVIDALTDNDELKDELRQRIFSQVSEAGDELSSTTIRDMFISALISMGEVALADKYVDYRTHDIEKWESVIDPGHKLNQLFNGQDTVVHENANKDSNIFSTRRDLTAGMVGKSLGLTLMPQTVAKAHLRGDIHYHDLDYSPLTSMTNCCLIDFKDMLANGFKIGNANVEPPKSIQTATAQMSQIIANVASSQYGGCSSDRTDEVLAPYAELNYKKHLAEAEQWVLPEKRESFARDKTKKDIYDAMQALEYEVNTLFSSNGQTPFTTVGFGLGTSWIG